MEQKSSVFEFQMGPEKFRFEASSETQAKQFRKYAMIHFMDLLGHDYLESKLEGPLKVEYLRKASQIA